MKLAAIFLTVAMTVTVPAHGDDEETSWQPVNESLQALLDSGWTIATMSTSGLPATALVRYDFLLTKNGKNVVCFLLYPTDKKRNPKSTCRAIN